METAQPVKKVTKGKIRLSMGLSRTSPSPVTETTVDVNGEKEVEQEETPTENNKETVEVDIVKKDETVKPKSGTQGKKRKHDETKDNEPQSEDSNNEFHGFSGETETVTEKDTAITNEEKQETKPVVKTDKIEPVPQESAFGKGKRSRIPNKKYESLNIKSFNKLAQHSSTDHDSDDKLEIDEKTENGVISKLNSSEVTSSMDGLKDDEDGSGSQKDDVQSEVTSSAHSSPSVGSRSSQKGSRLSSIASPGTPHAKKQKLTVDLTNPCYLKPFEYGWKRELVYRATSDSSMKRNGDIYYYTPSGKKVRSMREVAENLKNKELTLDDFTFFKEPLAINDPEKEIIRDAKMKGGGGTPNFTKKATPKAKPSREKITSPKVTTPVVVPVETAPSPKVGKSPRLGGFKVKLPGSRLNQGSTKSERKRASAETDMEIGMLPPLWSPKKNSGGKQSGWQAKSGSNMPIVTSPLDSKPCRPCSIRCLGVSGLIPTLQCRLCLCLYHTECVGLGGHSDTVQGYVCKNCQLDNQDKTNVTSGLIPNIAPPPLTPISSLKSNNMQSATPPKLQRIPRPGEKTPIPITPHPQNPNPASRGSDSPKSEILKITRINKLSTVSRLVKVGDQHLGSQPETNKGILGSVTTWFPPSSTIQMTANNSLTKTPADVVPAPRPQSIAFIGDRKFLIIPKHNILSVSPTIGAAVNTPSAKPIASPTADKAPAPYFNDKDKMPLASVPVAASLGPVVTSEDTVEIQNVEKEASLPTSSKSIMNDKADTPDSEFPETPTSTESTSAQAKQEDLTQLEPTETLTESPPESPPKPKKTLTRKSSTTSTVVTKVDTDAAFMQNYLQNLSYGYQTLLYVFQYLKVQDLLRAGCVCTMWRDIAGHPSLWKTVRMKNSQVADWEGVADALEKHNTQNLDLRKMLLPNNGDDMWPLFSKAIARVDTLLRIELCRCPATVVEELAKSNSNLRVINAVTIRCEKLDLTPVDHLINLQELRLKSTNGFSLTSDLSPLKKLTKLKHLSLTSVKDLNKLNVEVIGDLQNLESLDLGECSDFPENFGSDIISKLTKLEKLRLEKGQGSCCTFNILEAVSQIPSLEQLELVNFDVKAGFDKALGACTNIKKLLIIPTYISQSATTNHMVLGGVIKLKTTLSHFVWGVTLELLRVTELFVDQCEETPGKEKKKPTGNGDSIPVLKPVPIMKVEDLKTGESSPSKEPPQVEILPLPTLQKLLLNCLPTTRVKILKIPFHATWRQSIVDTVN